MVNFQIPLENKAPMRETIEHQLPIVLTKVEHVHARELARIGELLDELPQVARLVIKDLVGKRSRKTGRRGLSGDQVVRCLVVKLLTGCSYRQLAFHLEDSISYRAFCLFGIADRTPSYRTLQGNIKKVRPETMEKVNALVVAKGIELEVDDGDKVRIDSTVMEANILSPHDSQLLRDCVRVLTKLMGQASELVAVRYSDHSRRAKRRSLEICNTGKPERRERLYRELLQVTCWTLGYVPDAIKALERSAALFAPTISAQLTHFSELTKRVIDQTQRRVLGGEAVPAREKLVSIFEPHTDIIVKDRRETYYGHKTFLSVGASGMIFDITVEHGNPADSSRAVHMLERHQEKMGVIPTQAAFDGGFASKSNLRELKEMGVEDVAFAKKVGLKVSDMTRTEAIYKQLRRFRAGVEGVISFLKRSLGFGRCNWSGFDSFHAYAWSSVFTANLLIVARSTMT